MTVSGGSNVIAALGKVEEEVRAALAAAVQVEARSVQADEQQAVPVATGALQSGITVRQVSELAAEIGIYDPDLIYAIWIEFGRSSAAAQPFATPASELSRNRWPQRAGEAAGRAAKAV